MINLTDTGSRQYGCDKGLTMTLARPFQDYIVVTRYPCLGFLQEWHGALHIRTIKKKKKGIDGLSNWPPLGLKSVKFMILIRTRATVVPAQVQSNEEEFAHSE